LVDRCVERINFWFWVGSEGFVFEDCIHEQVSVIFLFKC